MQLKTVEERVRTTEFFECAGGYAYLLRQDRADIRALLKNEIELLRQAEWVADGDSNYLEACNDFERVVDTLLPGEVSN